MIDVVNWKRGKKDKELEDAAGIFGQYTEREDASYLIDVVGDLLNSHDASDTAY